MRKIIAYKGYFSKFMAALNEDERRKVRKTMLLLSSDETMPRHYVKPLEEAIYELRVTLPTKEARVFFIYDGETLVVLFNAFVKKTRKTPHAELEKAKRLKKEYYESK